MLKTLFSVAFLANGVLLFVVMRTVFVQTHWNDPGYGFLVMIMLGTPLLSMTALGALLFPSRSEQADSPER